MGCVQSQEELLDKPRAAIRSMKLNKLGTQKTNGSTALVADTGLDDGDIDVDYVEDKAVDILRADSKIASALAAKRRGDVFDESFEPDARELQDEPRVERSEEVEALLRGALAQNILFRDLADADQLKYVLNALTRESVKKGAELITQGDRGDVFYIVEEGKFAFDVDGADAGQCEAGGSFGELALLYNSPRAATVRSLTKATVWCLERADFRHIVAGNVAKKQTEVKKALRKVSLLSHLSSEQLAKVSDAVETVKFKAGETIIRKGDQGNVFFMIVRGQVKCTRAGTARKSYTDLTLKAGDYFGERSLLTKEPRAANVIASKDTECLVLHEEDFTNLLGPLRDVIDQNLGLRVLITIPLFESLSETQVKKLIKSMKEETFADGDVIIKQGDSGSKFYLIREGTARVVKNVDAVRGSDAAHVAELSAGDYFGEGALLRDEPRAASVEATSDEVVCLTMERRAFEKLLGGAGDVLRRELDQREDQATQKVEERVRAVEETLRLSDLKMLQTLGTGTFGRVRLVRAQKLDRTYALKQLQKAQIVAYRQQNNVMNEKNILMEVANDPDGGNPFILRLYRTFRDKHCLYLLFEVILGGELFSLIHLRGGALSPSDARFYAACTMHAIAYLHRRNIVYRDLKPENLMIAADGYLKVVDFGFAKRMPESGKTFTLCGTPEYLAPELVLGKGHDKAVDNWAIGVLVFEMINGQSPFADPSNDHMAICKNIVRGKIDWSSGRTRRFPEKAKDLVLALLTRDTLKRLGSQVAGSDAIMEHPFFAKVDFNDLKRKRVKQVPWIPPIQDDQDTSNFDEYDESDYIEPYRSTGTNWDAEF